MLDIIDCVAFMCLVATMCLSFPVFGIVTQIEMDHIWGKPPSRNKTKWEKRTEMLFYVFFAIPTSCFVYIFARIVF